FSRRFLLILLPLRKTTPTASSTSPTYPSRGGGYYDQRRPSKGKRQPTIIPGLEVPIGRRNVGSRKIRLLGVLGDWPLVPGDF
ncbi:hypothetical protein HID58_040095, partial [Brassica napus]